MIAIITLNPMTAIFIKQRYKSGLNSDRILARATEKHDNIKDKLKTNHSIGL